MEHIPAINFDLDAKPFQACLHEVLHFTKNALVDYGHEPATDLAYWSYEDITKWVAHKEKLHNNSGGAANGDMKNKGLIDFTLLVHEKVCTGLQVDITEFDDDACHASIVEV
jgi:hypothetical protein